MKDMGIVHIRTKDMNRGPVAMLGACGDYFLGAWSIDFDSLALKIYSKEEICKDVCWSNISPQATLLKKKLEKVEPNTHKKVFQMLRKLEFVWHKEKEKKMLAAL